MLKRTLSILFLLVYINSFTELHEVMRLPILLEHYSEHKNLSQEISFWDFLEMHYKTDVAHDEHDNELPFKVAGHCFNAHSATEPDVKIAVTQLMPIIIAQPPFHYKESSFNSPLIAIFQPPKAC